LVDRIGEEVRLSASLSLEFPFVLHARPRAEEKKEKGEGSVYIDKDHFPPVRERKEKEGGKKEGKKDFLSWPPHSHLK